MIHEDRPPVGPARDAPASPAPRAAPRPELAALFNRVSPFIDLAAAERDALRDLFGPLRDVPADVALQNEGDANGVGYVIETGWAYCFKALDDGGRQIVNFQIAGDFIGLRSLILRTADHSFATHTPCRLAPIRDEAWSALLEAHPRIATAMLWAAAREEALIVEHLVNVGRRSAERRTAHLLCELALRMQAQSGREAARRVLLPLTQTLLADALGLSAVHLNRSFRKLREAGTVRTAGGGGLEITDLPRLMALCGFDERTMPSRRG